VFWNQVKKQGCEKAKKEKFHCVFFGNWFNVGLITDHTEHSVCDTTVGQLPWGGQYHGEYYSSWITPEDSYLENGSLILRCRKATGGEFGGKPWSEGFIFGHEWAYYGYVEIRARYPLGKGIWGGLWMLHYGWPPEFDIAEYFGTDDKMNMGLCYKYGDINWWDSIFIYNIDFENWHTYGMEWGPGFANFYIDDVLRRTVERPQVPDVPMYTMLQSGMDWTYNETTPNPNYYEVDYVRWYKNDILPRYHPDFLPRIIDCTHEDVAYTGTWYPSIGYMGWMGNEYYTWYTGAVCEFGFTGTKVAWYSSKRNDLGKAEILLDGELVDTIDCYSPTFQYHHNLYESPELTYGEHTLGVRVTGEKNPLSGGTVIIIDAFRYANDGILCEGDINNDNTINYEDLASFGLQWPDTGCGACGGADFTGEGDVTIEDLVIMAQHWLADCILTGHWKLDGDSTDSSCHGFDGTLYGNPVWDPNGRVDGALKLDGEGDYVKITGWRGIAGASPRTVCAWVKTETTGDIVSWGDDEAGKRWLFYVNPDGLLRLAVYGGYIKSSTNVADGVWHHVAAVLPEGVSDANEVELYVDGLMETQTTSSSQLIDTANYYKVKIGAYNDPDRYFNGLIDDVRIYNRALGQDEIENIAGL